LSSLNWHLDHGVIGCAGSLNMIESSFANDLFANPLFHGQGKGAVCSQYFSVTLDMHSRPPFFASQTPPCWFFSVPGTIEKPPGNSYVRVNFLSLPFEPMGYDRDPARCRSAWFLTGHAADAEKLRKRDCKRGRVKQQRRNLTGQLNAKLWPYCCDCLGPGVRLFEPFDFLSAIPPFVPTQSIERSSKNRTSTIEEALDCFRFRQISNELMSFSHEIFDQTLDQNH
jgi:hypothetical protein